MAEGRAPASFRLAVWGGAIALVLVAAGGAAMLLRWTGDGPEARCADSGGIWDFEAQACAEPHAPAATES